MTIKELIDKHGGISEFYRVLQKKKKTYNRIPSRYQLYNHYRGGQKKMDICFKELYKYLGVTDFNFNGDPKK
jgi:hypothetical protein